MRIHSLLPVVTASVLAGCGEGNERAATRTPCPPVADAGVAAATDHYVRNVEPRPHRFMVMVGTDSTLPDAARRVLQDRGPTYLFPADTGQQMVLRQRLADTGGWTTLLVVLREVSEPARGRAEIELGGHYASGLDALEPAPGMRIAIECVNGAWRVSGGASGERVS